MNSKGASLFDFTTLFFDKSLFTIFVDKWHWSVIKLLPNVYFSSSCCNLPKIRFSRSYCNFLLIQKKFLPFIIYKTEKKCFFQRTFQLLIVWLKWKGMSGILEYHNFDLGNLSYYHRNKNLTNKLGRFLDKTVYEVCKKLLFERIPYLHFWIKSQNSCLQIILFGVEVISVEIVGQLE